MVTPWSVRLVMNVYLLLRASSGRRRAYDCVLHSRLPFERLQLAKDLVGIDGKQALDVHSENLDPVAKRAVQACVEPRRFLLVRIPTPAGARVILKQFAELFPVEIQCSSPTAVPIALSQYRSTDGPLLPVQPG